MELILKELVNNYNSNEEGMKLFGELKKAVETDCLLILAVDSEAAMSSSFLNSSIGLFLETFGLETFRRLIKFKGSKNQFERLATYIQKYTSCHVCA